MNHSLFSNEKLDSLKSWTKYNQTKTKATKSEKHDGGSEKSKKKYMKPQDAQ